MLDAPSFFIYSLVLALADSNKLVTEFNFFNVKPLKIRGFVQKNIYDEFIKQDFYAFLKLLKTLKMRGFSNSTK